MEDHPNRAPNRAANTGRDGGRHRVPAPAGADGDRLDRVLAGALPALSRTRLKALIVGGQVALETHGTAGGRTIDEPSYRVKPGQIFAVFVPDSAPPEPAGETIPLAIVHEDDDVVVLDKPAGLVVHPAPGNPAGTLVNALIAHCGDSLSGIGGVRRPGIVHRLDKLTSGLMVVAKNDRSHAALSSQFKARTITRAYTALIWGRPARTQGTIEGNIGRSQRNRKKMAVLALGGRPALTRWRLVRGLGRLASVLECRLATGRTHQIRVHLAYLGLPVIGDATYGGGLSANRRALIADEAAAGTVAALGRQALHAHRLGFVHPGTRREMSFESNLPIELKELDNVLDRI